MVTVIVDMKFLQDKSSFYEYLDNYPLFKQSFSLSLAELCQRICDQWPQRAGWGLHQEWAEESRGGKLRCTDWVNRGTSWHHHLDLEGRGKAQQTNTTERWGNWNPQLSVCAPKNSLSLRTADFCFPFHLMKHPSLGFWFSPHFFFTHNSVHVLASVEFRFHSALVHIQHCVRSSLPLCPSSSACMCVCV